MKYSLNTLACLSLGFSYISVYSLTKRLTFSLINTYAILSKLRVVNDIIYTDEIDDYNLRFKNIGKLYDELSSNNTYSPSLARLKIFLGVAVPSLLSS